MTSKVENPGMFRNGTGSTFPHGEDAIVWIWRWFVTRDSTKQRECLRDSWARNCHSVYYPRQCVDLPWICGWKYNLPACGHSPAEWCLWHWNSCLTSWACPAISGNSSPQDVLSLYVRPMPYISLISAVPRRNSQKYYLCLMEFSHIIYYFP